MTLAFNKQDPVEGLVQYVKNIKPYHTKILDVLIEYIHEEYMKVNIKDELDLCVNLGFPNFNSLFTFNIVDIVDTTNSFLVPGDATKNIIPGQRIELALSTHNNGYYYVKALSYNESANLTAIQVVETIPAPTDTTGQIADNFIQLCPNGMVAPYVGNYKGILCDGGYGLIYDSLLYDAFDIDVVNNTISIFGDHVDYISSTTTITLIDPPAYDGTPKSEIVAVLHVGSAVYNGAYTIITINQDLTPFNIDLNKNYKLLAKFVGFDDPLFCRLDDSDGRNETIFVRFKEEFHIDLGLNFNETINVYDMENRNTNAFDVVDTYVISSTTAPNVPETITPPAVPSLNDLWFDTSIQVLKQWQNYGWKNVQNAFWFEQNTTDIQLSKYYKLVKNAFTDTGWVEVDPLKQDILSDSFGNGPFSDEPYAVYHPEEEVNLVDNKTIQLSGGDFTKHLMAPNTFDGYGNSSILGTYKADSFGVENIINNSFILDNSLGDKSYLFTQGTVFYYETIDFNSKWYTINNISFDGTNTILNVVETIDIVPDILNTSKGLGTIPSLFFTPANAISPIIWNGERKPTTTIYIKGNFNTNVNTIIYSSPSPYVIDIKTNFSDTLNITNMTDEFGLGNELLGLDDNGTTSTDIAQTNITDEIIFSWGDITDWFQYTIIGIDQTNKEITVAGNATIDIQPNQEISIIGNVDNVGIYTALTIVYNGYNSIITVSENIPTDTVSGGFVESSTVLPMSLYFNDSISVNVNETESDVALTTSGPIINGSSFKFLDIGTMDENYEIIKLINK